MGVLFRMWNIEHVDGRGAKVMPKSRCNFYNHGNGCSRSTSCERGYCSNFSLRGQAWYWLPLGGEACGWIAPKTAAVREAE